MVREGAQRHDGLVEFVLGRIHPEHAVALLTDHELVQVGVSPAEPRLEQLVELGQSAGGGHLQ